MDHLEQTDKVAQTAHARAMGGIRVLYVIHMLQHQHIVSSSPKTGHQADKGVDHPAC
jgi:hypothetical protein